MRRRLVMCAQQNRKQHFWLSRTKSRVGIIGQRIYLQLKVAKIWLMVQICGKGLAELSISHGRIMS